MQSNAGAPAVGNVLQQLQRALQQQQLTGTGSLVTIGGPTVVAGRSTITTSGVAGSTPSTPTYSYKVKIINPAKKSDVSVRYLNNHSEEFESVNTLRVKLIEAFQEAVPNTLNFNVGYYEGSQQSNVWLVVSEDLSRMYQKYPDGGSVNLWCGARCQEDEVENARKRKRDAESSKKASINENERDVDEVYKKLLDKQGGKWDTPRLRLWAHCICAQQHSSCDDPPDLPAFKDPEPKRRKESLSDALAGGCSCLCICRDWRQQGTRSHFI